MNDGEIDHEWTHYPVCPHCGFIDREWWDGTDKGSDDSTWEAECGNCDKSYTVHMSVMTRFSTEKKDRP